MSNLPMKITVDNLHFTFASGVAVLRGVSLQIAAGERVAIMGRNGSGKSTLVRHFNGLLHPTHGVVTIGDWATHMHSISHDIDFVAEHFARVIVMDAGRILLDAPPEQVFGASEALTRAALQPPQLTRLAQALALSHFVCTEEEFLGALQIYLCTSLHFSATQRSIKS